MTAHANTDIHSHCFASGMNDCLVKPFDREQLQAMLGRWL
jgi:CheY-like chemotaxis protein